VKSPRVLTSVWRFGAGIGVFIETNTPRASKAFISDTDRAKMIGFTMNTTDRTIDMGRIISLFKNQDNRDYSPALDPVWREVTERAVEEDPPDDPPYFTDLMEYLRQRNAAVVGRDNNRVRDRTAVTVFEP